MANPPPKNTPLVLIIRDGWGENPYPEHDTFNAVKLARTPVDDMLRRDWPWTLIKTSGEDVGLPEGTMGNSEVGHQNIGAGRIVDQESVAITKSARAGFDHNEAIASAIARARDTGRNLHLMGINSDAGVHGLLHHLFALLETAKKLRMPGDRVFIHLFTDGRDTGPYTGLDYARQVEAKCRELGGSEGVGGGGPRVASVIGRYYAMDRDFRWERVSRAYGCLTGRGPDSVDLAIRPTAEAAIQRYYDKPSSDSMHGDEFIVPTVVAASVKDAEASRITDGDSVIFYNYRGDRPRELCMAFVYPDELWDTVKPSPDTGKMGFDRGQKLGLHFVTMTAYSEALAPLVHVAYPKAPKMTNIAGEYLSSLALRQFRCAETEKYPHVTFFFNDYRDGPFPGENRENPQSPKVPTYDLKPEMSADQVRDAVLRRLATPDCEDLIVVNFANGDMVGHTGNLQAAIRACETVDACVGAIIDATLKRGGSLIVTADHGNAEQMFDPQTGSPHTAHTIYDVPLHVVGEPFRSAPLRGDHLAAQWYDPDMREQRGRLADILPTALDMMGLPRPPEMTGRSLLTRPVS